MMVMGALKNTLFSSLLFRSRDERIHATSHFSRCRSFDLFVSNPPFAFQITTPIICPVDNTFSFSHRSSDITFPQNNAEGMSKLGCETTAQPPSIRLISLILDRQHVPRAQYIAYPQTSKGVRTKFYLDPLIVSPILSHPQPHFWGPVPRRQLPNPSLVLVEILGSGFGKRLHI
jgi:hypothetical protein